MNYLFLKFKLCCVLITLLSITSINAQIPKCCPNEIGFGGQIPNCRPNDPPGPIVIRGMGNNGSIKMQCVNGAYRLWWDPIVGNDVFIGRCAYDWGENEGKYCKNAAGAITKVCYYNEEGHHGHGRNPNNSLNGHVHDDENHGKHDGKLENDCYSFDVTTGKLKAIKYTKVINQTTWLEQGCWSKDTTFYDGDAPENYNDLIQFTASGNSLEEGVDNDQSYVGLAFYGTSEIGSMSISILETEFNLDLLGGESADDIISQIVGMINSNTELAGYSIEAFAFPSSLEMPSQLNITSIMDYDVTFSVSGQSSGGIIIEETCSLSANVPALSQWGVIILSLLLLTLGSASIIRRQQVVFATSDSEAVKPSLFDLELFKKIALRSVPFILGVIAIISIVEGRFFVGNVAGTLISGIIVVYLIQLIILSRESQVGNE